MNKSKFEDILFTTEELLYPLLDINIKVDVNEHILDKHYIKINIKNLGRDPIEIKDDILNVIRYLKENNFKLYSGENNTKDLNDVFDSPGGIINIIPINTGMYDKMYSGISFFSVNFNSKHLDTSMSEMSIAFKTINEDNLDEYLDEYLDRNLIYLFLTFYLID